MKSIVVVVAMNRKEIVFLAPFIKKTTRDQPSCKVVSEPSSADNAHISSLHITRTYFCRPSRSEN
jgi:hypothetical protein